MIAVIACGNLARCDDGAGPAVLERLRAHPQLRQREDIRLHDAATDGMAVMYQARGARALHLIDASRSGAPAGTLSVVPGAEFEAQREPPRDSHALRWDDALTIGRRLYRQEFPREVQVYLIEAQNLGLGLELSPPVRAAVEKLAVHLAETLCATEPAAC